MKKFLLKNLGMTLGRKNPLFAGIPSIYMAYLPRFAKIYGRLPLEKSDLWHVETADRGNLNIRYWGEYQILGNWTRKVVDGTVTESW